MIALNLKGADIVNLGADGNAVAALESQLGRPLPEGYRNVLATANGFSLGNGLSIYSSENVFERNMTFKVPGYAPGFLAIGDDSGGRSILIPFEGEGVYIVDQGSMDPDDFEQLSISLANWVSNGCPMSLRRGD